MSKRRYETLLAIDTRGKEDTAKEIIERLEKDIAVEGIQVEQIQRLEKRDFAYPHRHANQAYFVNFVILAEPKQIEKLQQKLKHDSEVSLQQYIRLSDKPAEQAA